MALCKHSFFAAPKVLGAAGAGGHGYHGASRHERPHVAVAALYIVGLALAADFLLRRRDLILH
ncbi:MAG TPA: hypothetical protein VFU69_13765 [Ktedonobacterales bacterium]|nr:hypothetical protein [Ktedonobacterales bacterium]